MLCEGLSEGADGRYFYNFGCYEVWVYEFRAGAGYQRYRFLEGIWRTGGVGVNGAAGDDAGTGKELRMSYWYA